MANSVGFPRAGVQQGGEKGRLKAAGGTRDPAAAEICIMRIGRLGGLGGGTLGLSGFEGRETGPALFY